MPGDVSHTAAEVRFCQGMAAGHCEGTNALRTLTEDNQGAHTPMGYLKRWLGLMDAQIKLVERVLPFLRRAMVQKDANRIITVFRHKAVPVVMQGVVPQATIRRGIEQMARRVLDEERHAPFAGMAQDGQFLPLMQRKLVFSRLRAFKRARHMLVFYVVRKIHRFGGGMGLTERKPASQCKGHPEG